MKHPDLLNNVRLMKDVTSNFFSDLQIARDLPGRSGVTDDYMTVSTIVTPVTKYHQHVHHQCMKWEEGALFHFNSIVVMLLVHLEPRLTLLVISSGY